MTALAPALIVPGTTEPTVHYGWNGIRLMMSNDLGEDLAFAHLFGSDFHSVFPTSDGAVDKSRGDHSWQERHLTNFGVSPGAKNFTSGASAYYLTPLTLDEMLALGGGKMTLVGVGKFGNANSVVAGSYNGLTINGVTFGRPGTNYFARIAYADGGKPDISSPTFAPDGDSGVVYEMLAMTIDNVGLELNFYRHKAGGTLQTATQALTYAAAGTNAFGIGKTYPGAQYTAATSLVGLWGFSDALSAGRIAALQAGLKTFLADYSITI